VIELRDITFSYRGTERPALNRVNLVFQAGEFALVCGGTGSGKSTLLRIMNGLAPHFTGGELSGELLVAGQNLTGKLPHDLAAQVGFVNQQPESSFVTDTVQEELAYGMEQLGFEPNLIASGIERVAAQLGISDLLESPLAWLSGGQQQRVAIAAALAAGQRTLLLDEPTSALDPAAAAEIVRVLEDLAHNHGITVILVEHRIERVIELVDSIVVVGSDGLVTKGGTEQFKNYHLVPPLIALGTNLGWEPIPVAVSDAKMRWEKEARAVSPKSRERKSQEVALAVRELSVSYGQHQAISNLSFDVHQGEVLAIMGENGAGKSSLLWALQGSGARSSGSAQTKFGDPAELSAEERLCVVTMVPQKAADLLFLNSLAEELAESDKFSSLPEASTASIFETLTGRLDPKIHPRDLSAGQQLALVVALQLVKGAGILLLDEPTRGLDYAAKKSLAGQLALLAQGKTTVIVASHDVEFVALVADRVLLLQAGALVSDAPVAEALGFRSTFPTQLAQITNLENVLTLEDVIGEEES
jgi:energy-coupling factor transport system ATP-binding protein